MPAIRETRMKLTYSIAEACELLGIGRTTLYGAIKKGELKACKVGRRTLISSQSLQLFVDSLPNSNEQINKPEFKATTERA